MVLLLLLPFASINTPLGTTLLCCAVLSNVRFTGTGTAFNTSWSSGKAPGQGKGKEGREGAATRCRDSGTAMPHYYWDSEQVTAERKREERWPVPVH